MRGSRRRAPRRRRGIWGLLSRLFGAPKGRHVVGAPPPPPAPAARPAKPAPGPAPEVARAAAPEPRAAIPPPVQAGPEPVGTVAPFEPASVRLIFVDGSVVPLPEGSPEGRQAQDLARRVLDATRHHAG